MKSYYSSKKRRKSKRGKRCMLASLLFEKLNIRRRLYGSVRDKSAKIDKTHSIKSASSKF